MCASFSSAVAESGKGSGSSKMFGYSTSESGEEISSTIGGNGGSVANFLVPESVSVVFTDDDVASRVLLE